MLIAPNNIQSPKKPKKREIGNISTKFDFFIRPSIKINNDSNSPKTPIIKYLIGSQCNFIFIRLDFHGTSIKHIL